MVIVLVSTSNRSRHYSCRPFVTSLDDRERKRVVRGSGFPEYSLDPFDFVWKPGLPATGSGFSFRDIRVPVCDEYSPGYTSIPAALYQTHAMARKGSKARLRHSLGGIPYPCMILKALEAKHLKRVLLKKITCGGLNCLSADECLNPLLAYLTIVEAGVSNTRYKCIFFNSCSACLL